jgi:uncharacterized protein HemX
VRNDNAGWYIHMEAAKQAVDRLRLGDVPADFPGGPANAKQLGDNAYKWRNYLAWGAIGPDIFCSAIQTSSN